MKDLSCLLPDYILTMKCKLLFRNQPFAIPSWKHKGLFSMGLLSLLISLMGPFIFLHLTSRQANESSVYVPLKYEYQGAAPFSSLSILLPFLYQIDFKALIVILYLVIRNSGYVATAPIPPIFLLLFPLKNHAAESCQYAQN
jgi:hypothetical protein